MPFDKSTKVDAIIVGGGLAGIHLCLAMERVGLKGVIVDRPDSRSSSRVAAGVINPITGRRFALSWLYHRLHPVFTEVYAHWEQQWNAQFLTRKNIFRSVPANKLINDLDVKLSDPAFAEYCRPMRRDEIKQVSGIIRFGEPGYVMHGYQLDTARFLDLAIAHLKAQNKYIQGSVSEPVDQLDTQVFRFGTLHSETMIWATGAWIVLHPAFGWVEMNPNKGEVLKVQVPGSQGEEIIKQSAFYVPMKEDHWWVGTYDSWEWDHEPSTDGLRHLRAKLEAFQQPANLISHVASVRPAVRDRRPVIGPHPGNTHLYLFNGFGSKGTSLIPYFAKMLADHLRDGKAILPEVDVKRFWPS